MQYLTKLCPHLLLTKNAKRWLSIGGGFPQAYNLFEAIQAGTCPLQLYLPRTFKDFPHSRHHSQASAKVLTSSQFAQEQPFAATLGLDYFQIGDVLAVIEESSSTSSTSDMHCMCKVSTAPMCLAFLVQRLRGIISNTSKGQECLKYVKWARPLFTEEGIYQYILLLMTNFYRHPNLPVPVHVRPI